MSSFPWGGLLFYVVLTISIVITIVLVYPILNPTIVTYPWNTVDDDDDDDKDSTRTTSTTSTKKKKKKIHQTVIFAASYNPPHNGHLAMLQYLSTRYTNVIAVVGFNPNKRYPVSPDDRAELLREMLKSLQPRCDNIRVEVVEGYIWRYAKRQGATLFVRGIRSWEKDVKDERALHILNTWGPIVCGPLYWPIPTMYLEGDPKYVHVSSTLIREICNGGIILRDEGTSHIQQEGGATSTKSMIRTDTKAALSQLVPANVTERVAELYGK